MEQIRYQQRICTDTARIEEFLTKTRTGVIGISGADYPYCVPVNYIWRNGAVYFHGLGSSKKTELLEAHPRVSFTVYEEFGTVKDPVPCHADTSYMSVMLFGLAERVKDNRESAEALQAIVDKFMPGFYHGKISPALAEKYRSSQDDKAVAVYKIVPVERTAKVNAAAEEKLFRES
jgi:nitroimidazol reductase NimA-like FMN-containing flavoprotein (pyridoxamine 5'-phosphate oxidase superfamily)